MLPATRRTRWCPRLGWKTASTPLPTCMAARRCCSPWPGHSRGVERSRSTAGACSRRPEPNALKNRRNKAREGGFQRGGALRQGRAKSGERLRFHGWLSPRSSVRRGLPRRRRARWRLWRRECPAEMAGGKRRSFGQQWRCGGTEWERLRAKERGDRGKWGCLGEWSGVPTGSCRSEPGDRGHVADVRPPHGRCRVEKVGRVHLPPFLFFFEFLFPKNFKCHF